MTFNKVKMLNNKMNIQKNCYERCTFVGRVLKNMNIHRYTDVNITNSDSETWFIAMVHSIQMEKEFNLVNQILQMLSLIKVNIKKKLKLCTRA